MKRSKMSTKKTANAGAAIERGKLIAKLTRMRLDADGEAAMPGYNVALNDLEVWVNKSAARASKRPGGLGRK
jgi:hypothetical protein